MDRLEYRINDKTIDIVLTTDKKPKRISGHRMVDLLGGSNNYKTILETLLSFFGFEKFEEDNLSTFMGKVLEKPIIEAYCVYNGYTDENNVPKYNYYEFTTGKNGNYGDMFKDEDFTGLIDAELDDILLEIKTYSGDLGKQLKFKYRNAWDTQARMYLSLWNKKFPLKRKKRIDLVSYFIDDDEVEYYRQCFEEHNNDFLPLSINMDNLKVFHIEPYDKFDEMMKKAKDIKDELIHKIGNNQYGISIKNNKKNREALEKIKIDNPELEVIER